MPARRKQLLFFVCSLLVTSVARAQSVFVSGGSAAAQNGTSSLAAPPASRTVHGQVVNATNGTAIPRALVNLNSRQVLTDFQGRFEFPQFADTQASVSVTKPGYSQSADAGQGFVQQKISDLSATVEVKLYPNAVILGTVAGSDGLPLSQIPITLRRALYDGSVGLRWPNAGFSTTNSRGDYRFAVPAGRYRISVGYVAHAQDTGDAVLSSSFPDSSSSATSSSWIDLRPGEDKRVDLRPHTGPAHPLLIRVDESSSRQGIRFSAISAEGERMNLPAAPDSRPGEYRVELPSGTYIIDAQSDLREETLFGTGHVTIAGTEPASLAIHLAPAAFLPIEVVTNLGTSAQNSASGAPPPPNVAQLGLLLHSVSGASDPFGDIPARPREDRTFEFRVPAGRYRLLANGRGPWHVESATYGGITDLTTNDLVIGVGSAGQPIRMVASNLMAAVQGQVALTPVAPSAWVYFFRMRPSLTILDPKAVRSDGSFSASLPLGSYSVVAFSHRLQEDLSDPEVVRRLTTGTKTVDVTSSGATPVVSLEVSQTEAPE